MRNNHKFVFPNGELATKPVIPNGVCEVRNLSFLPIDEGSLVKLGTTVIVSIGEMR